MTLKTLILGAAAGTLAVAGAHAADLPVSAEPVDYVRVCDAQGTGFFYIPGTETCLRVGGRVRADYRVTDAGWDDRADNGIEFRARGYMRLDSRTETEYGLLRTYTDLWFTNTAGGADGLTIWEAFVQLGGLTAGRTESFFDFFAGSSWGSQIGQGLDERANVLAYTAAFGNGMSASLSLEDNTDREGAISGGTNGGQRLPDLIANVRVDQGWGSAQVMGALSNTNVVAAIDSEVGYAVGAGVTFKLPMIAAGDEVSFQAVYADGAVKYASTHFATDGTVVGGSIDTATAWNLAAGFTHNWTSTVSTSVTGTYGSLDANGTAQDVDQYGVHGTLAWAPVSGLVIGTEVEYLNKDFGTGTADDEDLTATFRIQRSF